MNARAAVLLMAIAFAFALHSAAWTFVADDAFIAFRYADNLVDFGELAFNVGPDGTERVEGYSDFLWVVLLAAGAALGIPPHRSAPVLTIASSLAAMIAIVLLVRLLRIHAGDRPADSRLAARDLLPAMLLVVVPEFMVWSHGGLETSLACALAVAAMVAWSSGRVVPAATLAALTGLVRTDALPVVAGFGLGWLAWAASIRGTARDAIVAAYRDRRRLGVATAVFVLPLLVHLLWRRAYYGDWLPNTWLVKQHGSLLRSSWGVDYLVAWAHAVHAAWLLPLLAFVRVRHLPLLVPLLLTSGWAWWVGGSCPAA